MNNTFVKTTSGPPSVLGGTAEDDLVNWIIDCQKGFPRRKNQRTN